MNLDQQNSFARTSSNKLEIKFNDHDLDETQAEKSVDLTANKHLVWNPHVKQICHKTATGFFFVLTLYSINFSRPNS